MSKTKKLLQDCPNCSYQFKPDDYIANSAICRDCHKSFPRVITQPNLLYRYRKHFVATVLIIGTLNFSILVYKNRAGFAKKDTAVSGYIKHYWDDFKEEHSISIIQGCIQKNYFQCQMLAYKRLTELNPENSFYKKNYKAKLKKFNDPPRLDFSILSF